MAGLRIGWGSVLLALALVLVVLPDKAAAFGAGNIPSIAQVEGHNWRHGDIEDLLKTLAFINGKKWTTMMVGRTYFGNWLRDYSQAIDVGSLKGVNAPTIRIIVWVLSFLAHGYATEEFEVTEERLGVYRPEEHIDNPLGYADGKDAREYDPRLRGPVDPRELQIDPNTGMKNYIANEAAAGEPDGWGTTSAGYIRYSLQRCIHFGRLYTSGSHGRGKESDLCEALRCLGQALHTLEDFPAHSNYCELALIDMYKNETGRESQIFPHVGTDTRTTLRMRNGHIKSVWPLVTGTFGGVDFLHSVLGEANDHFTQSEVDEVNIALLNAEQLTKGSGGGGGSSRSGGLSLFGLSLGGSSGNDGDFISLVSKLPGVGDNYASTARSLKAASEAQEQENSRSAGNVNVVPGMSPNFDPVKTAAKIYPILEFRDKIVRTINNMIEKIPGLESLLEKISETLTAFILGLLAPFLRPIINQVTKVLKEGSSGVIATSAEQQFEPWNNPRCDNPTHSMLSKDHFTNVLNSCAGRVAATILQYVVPRIVYAWENPGVPDYEVIDDVLRAFHHPAAVDPNIEIQRMMYDTVKQWREEVKHKYDLERVLSSESVKQGLNHILNGQPTNRGPGGGHTSCGGDGGHGKVAGSLWSKIQTRDLDTSAPSGGGGGGGRSSSSTGHKYGYSASSSHHDVPAHGEAASYFSSADPRPASPPSGRYYGSRPSSSGYGSSVYGSGRPSPGPASFGYHHGGHQAYEGSSGFSSQPSYGGSSGPSYGGSSQPSYGSQSSYPPQPSYGAHPSQPSYGSQPPYGGPPHSPYGGGRPPSPPRPPGYGGGYAGYSAGPPPSHGGYGGGPPGGAPPYPHGGPAPYPHGGRADAYERNYDQHYERDDRRGGRDGRRRRGSHGSRSSSEERDGRGYPGQGSRGSGHHGGGGGGYGGGYGGGGYGGGYGGRDEHRRY
ncbi:glycine rich protein het-c3 [Copromyces sp. CBS 386.78]|nr:glycine rich protein het-c3 [Copromyces sp. CBS 386.78]